MASLVWPDWLSDLPADKLAIVKAACVQPWTLPKSFWFGTEPAPVIVTAPIISFSDVSDAEYEILKKHLPRSQRKNRVDYRNLLNALAYKRASGVRFVSIPSRYGSSGGLRKQAERLALLGVWSDLLEALPDLPLDPTRRQLFAGIAREWAATGQRLMKARGIEPPRPA